MVKFEATAVGLISQPPLTSLAKPALEGLDKTRCNYMSHGSSHTKHLFPLYMAKQSIHRITLFDRGLFSTGDSMASECSPASWAASKLNCNAKFCR